MTRNQHERPATGDEQPETSNEQPVTSNQKMAACPNCQQQIPEISAGKFCPFCGAPLSGASLSPEATPPSFGEVGPSVPETTPANALGASTPAQEFAVPGAVPSSYVHWEDRQRLGFLPAFSQTWSDSVFRPAEFFRRAPKTGNLGSALLYAILVVTTGGLLSIFWQYLFWDTFSNWQDLENIIGQEISRDILGTWALLLPIFAIISIFITSFIFHVCLMIIGSSRNGYEATLRGLCYSYGPYLFVIVPFCGGVIAGVWTFVLMIIGWREMHESTTGRVVLAVLLPFILCCGAILMLAWSLAGFFNRLAP
jgi:hypothetical protein